MAIAMLKVTLFNGLVYSLFEDAARLSNCWEGKVPARSMVLNPNPQSTKECLAIDVFLHTDNLATFLF